MVTSAILIDFQLRTVNVNRGGVGIVSSFDVHAG